ncbi:SAG-related sequence [Besnoitia besnoiti]|uniref:SAG-related sequence n=1 Tax=Besnoitia besnoiti TaxID=94643 RepID=A0A2A9MCF3_BESBE|nr:SAG-related sequence [Besnoitia besnoiti]PFH36168.1 SAG-related sequence [Besnoitia besnoiti]
MAAIRRRVHGRTAFKSKARKLLAVCLGGVLALSGGQGANGQAQDSPLMHNLRLENKPGSGPAGLSTCNFSTDDEAPTEPILTLSKDQTTVTLECTGNEAKFVPTEPTNVCVVKKDEAALKGSPVSEEDPSLKDCQGNTRKATVEQMALKDLLGVKDTIQWTDVSTPGIKKALHLESQQLPLTDKAFFVGCHKTPEDTPQKCKVTVNILARESTAEENVAKCAYGAASNNASPLKVDLSEANNTMELVCGNEGSIHPLSYTAKFCTDKGMDNCSEEYKDILPDFDAAWWTPGEGGGESAKLTIPAAGFPAEDQSFYIGCLHKTQQTESPPVSSSTTPGDAAAVFSPCSVLVTVKAASSDASAVPEASAATAAAAGVALTGILAGSL